MGRGTVIKQVYVPYWKWECYKSGMWSKVDKSTYNKMLDKAIEFTSDHAAYGDAMMDVSDKWRNSMLNFLTNKSINRKAYIGHCAVFYRLQIPEYIVRAAWKHLTEKQQLLANIEAEKTIKRWEKKQLEKSMNIYPGGKKDATRKGYQMKFQLK
jgi:Fe-S cluster biosynthesis and repair protein YggX